MSALPRPGAVGGGFERPVLPGGMPAGGAPGTDARTQVELDDALRLLRRLNAWEFGDGTRLSEHVVVDGFEPWWFGQEAVFWRRLVPYVRERAGLAPGSTAD